MLGSKADEGQFPVIFEEVLSRIFFCVVYHGPSKRTLCFLM